MEVIAFRYFGKFGHFLKAEANVNWLSYPHPPRTVLLGLVGAVLGLPKDHSQVKLKGSSFAIAGKVPQTHWHKANIRQIFPSALTSSIKKGAKGSIGTSKNAKQLPQEWLLFPDYTVYASIPEPTLMQEFGQRMEERRWRFGPSLGLSEMLAQLEWQGCYQAQRLSEGIHRIETVVPTAQAKLQGATILQDQLAIRLLRMPQDVDEDRVFSFQDYAIERDGKGIPVETAEAWNVGDKTIMFL